MDLYRISLTNLVGTNIEDKPFKSPEEADAYMWSQKEAYGAQTGKAVKLGEAVLMKVEVTDTYGGEANYCWVRRHEQWILKDVSDRECVRLAKKLEGWTSHPCRTENLGDGFTLRPRGLLQIMFVNFVYDAETA